MKRHPFTLIEILVAIVIIIILAGMLMPIIKKAAEKADNADTIERMKVLEKLLDEYKEYHGFYPQGGNAATNTPFELTTAFLDDSRNWKAIPKYSGANPTQDFWVGKFGPSATFDGFLTDVAEERLYYICPGKMNPEKFDLWSKGGDGMHGDGGTNASAALNRNDNDDVTNWKGDFK